MNSVIEHITFREGRMARTIARSSLFLFCLAVAVSAVAQDAPAPAAAQAAPQTEAATKPQTSAADLPGAPKSKGALIQNIGETKDPTPPDMVCFGYGPKWSVQFTNGEARYLGINQPDQAFLGDFYWVSEEQSWEWHRANGLAPMNGNFGLSASIQKESCQDPVRHETFPYTGQINLPQGDMVSGCCRKLKPGEAPVGKHGLQPATNTAQAAGAPATAAGAAGATTAQPTSASSGTAQPRTRPQAGIPQPQ
jgi:uncharacterized membrane protein